MYIVLDAFQSPSLLLVGIIRTAEARSASRSVVAAETGGKREARDAAPSDGETHALAAAGL